MEIRGGVLIRGVVLVVLPMILLVACTDNGRDPESTVEVPSLGPVEAFQEQLDELCGPYKSAANAEDDALTRSEFATRADLTIDALEDLEEEISDLEAPAEIEGPFHKFRNALAAYVSVRHEQNLVARSLKNAVRVDLRTATLLQKLWDLSKRLDAPDCPPRDIQQVRLGVFTSKVNKTCFRLIKEVRKADLFAQPTSFDSARAALVAFGDYQGRVVDVMKRSRPEGLHAPLVKRLIRVNQKREDILREMVSNFDALDESSFDANLDRQEKLWREAKNAAIDIGAIVCVNVVPK